MLKVLTIMQLIVPNFQACFTAFLRSAKSLHLRHSTLLCPLFVTDASNVLESDSILNVRYGISGNRSVGAHPPVSTKHSATEDAKQDLVFQSALVLQRPVLDPCLAVGFLPLPSSGLRVGQLVTMKWRVERLKDFQNELPQHHVSHEVIPFFIIEKC